MSKIRVTPSDIPAILASLRNLYQRWFVGYEVPDDPAVVFEKLVEVPGPFEVDIPDGPALHVCLVYNVRAHVIVVPGETSRDSTAHGECGITVLVDVMRSQSDADPFLARREFLIGKFAKAFGDAPTQSMSGDAMLTGDEIVATKTLLQIPAGGGGVLRGLITSDTAVSYAMLTLRRV